MEKIKHIGARAFAIAINLMLAAALVLGFSCSDIARSRAWAASYDLSDLNISSIISSSYINSLSGWNSTKTEIDSAKAYDFYVSSSAGYLTEGTDYAVEYDFSEVDKDTCAGKVTATLTGTGSYTGEASFSYSIRGYTLTVSGFADGDVVIGINELRDLIKSSKKNTSYMAYEYASGTVAKAVYVPAKQYISWDEILEYAGVAKSANGATATWSTITASASDGGYSYSMEANANGKFFPGYYSSKTSAGHKDTSGAYNTPGVLVLYYGINSITSTAGSVITRLDKAYTNIQAGNPTRSELEDFYWWNRSICGSTEEGYLSASTLLQGQKFRQNITGFKFNTSLSGFSYSISDQPFKGTAVDPFANGGTLTAFEGFELVPNKDFTYTLSNNTTLGTATVSITGTGSLPTTDKAYVKNGWTGTATIKFNIIEGSADESTDGPDVTPADPVDPKDEEMTEPDEPEVETPTVPEEPEVETPAEPDQPEDEDTTDPVDPEDEDPTDTDEPEDENPSDSDADDDAADETPAPADPDTGTDEMPTDPDNSDLIVPAYGSFTDVDVYGDHNAWYYDAVYQLASLGIITGYAHHDYKVFGVDDHMTRGDFATILWRYSCPDEYALLSATNYASAYNTTSFVDVPSNSYETRAISWAAENGIVTGYQDGSNRFGTEDSISFEQMVTIVARMAAGYDNAQDWSVSTILDTTRFMDGHVVSDWAQGPVAYAIDNGLVNGNDNNDGTFTITPLENVARQRVVTVLWRAMLAELL